MSQRREMKMKGGMNVDSAVSYLENLIESIKTGAVHLEKGANVMALHPSELLKVEVQAVQKKDKEKITIELAWKRSDFAPIEKGGLVISSVETQPSA